MKANLNLEMGVGLIKKWEGLYLRPYLCPAGLPTVGYGHLIKPTEFRAFGVSRDQDGYGLDLKIHINEDEADLILQKDVMSFVRYINQSVRVPLTILQFNALLSWTFNLGPTNLRSSTLLKVINRGDHGEVPYQIRRWNKSRGRVLQGLVNRREDEALLYQIGS